MRAPARMIMLLLQSVFYKSYGTATVTVHDVTNMLLLQLCFISHMELLL